MSKLALFGVLLFSNICFADLTGVWQGTLVFKGTNCAPTSIEINNSNDTLTISAPFDKAGYRSVQCGVPEDSYYFGLDEDFVVRGNELWRYDAQMGELAENSVMAKDRVCSANGCQYWDFLKITKISENKINFWINYEGMVLSGELTK